MNHKQFNLDVSSPDKLAPVLRAFADKLYSDASELEAAWQDKSAGEVWEKLAAVLDAAANASDKVCKKHGW